MRFQAIILTSLTTFATGITLLLIPSGYMILDDIHGFMEKLKSKLGV